MHGGMRLLRGGSQIDSDLQQIRQLARAVIVAYTARAGGLIDQHLDDVHQSMDILRAGIAALRIDNGTINMRHDLRDAGLQAGL